MLQMLFTASSAAALTSTAFISLAPNIILFLFPHYGSGEGSTSKVLKLGQAVAAGGLLGDVFLHSIPHATNTESCGLWILLGFTIFMITDMIIRSLEDGGGSHSHSHSHDCSNKTMNGAVHNHEKPTTTSSTLSNPSTFSSTIALNLVADALHNFTDGLAIGASFSIPTHNATPNAGDEPTSFLSLLTSSSRGGLATISILCHEIPHELGDFAVLVTNGYSKQQAILAQFGTAMAAMIGTIVGLYLGTASTSPDGTSNEGDHERGEALLYFTAGGFIYLATVTILPELLEDEPDLPQVATINGSPMSDSASTASSNPSFRRRYATLKYRLSQLICFGIGIGFLYGVSLLEDADHSHGNHHHGHALHDHNHNHHHAEFRSAIPLRDQKLGHHDRDDHHQKHDDLELDHHNDHNENERTLQIDHTQKHGHVQPLEHTHQHIEEHSHEEIHDHHIHHQHEHGHSNHEL